MEGFFFSRINIRRYFDLIAGKNETAAFKEFQEVFAMEQDAK